MSQCKPSFDTAAEFYEVLTRANSRLEREGPLLRECLADAPSDQAADLACGTGLHALFLAEDGAQVSAFDLSGEMIAFARRTRPHPRVSYAEGDMRHLAGGPYGLAICLGNSLCLLQEEDDLQECFDAAAANLSRGGLFLFQVRNGAAASALEPVQRIEHRTLEGAEVVAIKNLAPHPPCHTLLSLAFFAFVKPGVKTAAEAVLLRDWRREELEAAAGAAGLAIEACYAGFSKETFEPETSPDLVAVARKRG